MFEVCQRTLDCWCRSRGVEAVPCGSRSRLLTHCPHGSRPVKLLVRLRCFTCRACDRYWSEQVSEELAAPRSRLTRRAINWALASVVLGGMSINAAARNLATSWSTVNETVLEAGYTHLINPKCVRFRSEKV